MTLYEQYCQARLECGYDADLAIKKTVWDVCDQESQQNMVDQMRRGARQAAELQAKEEAYRTRYGEAW